MTKYIFMFIFMLLSTVCSGLEIGKKCTVCRHIVREIEWEISQVDPKKRVQVGSFRVDPDGNQKIKDKHYARSELYLGEVFESVCRKMLKYAEIAFEDGTSQMIRIESFDGQLVDTNGFDDNIDRGKGKSLRYQCENFLEDHEEEMIAILQKENIPNYENAVCGQKLGVCSNDELWQDFLQLPVKERREEDEELPADIPEDTEDIGDAEEETDGASDMDDEPQDEYEKTEL